MPKSSRAPPIAKLIDARAVMVSILLSGCFSYDPQPLAPMAIAGNFESRALDGPELHRYIEPHLGADSSPTVAWDLAVVILGGRVTSTLPNLLAIAVLALLFGRLGELPRDAAEAATALPK